MILHLLLRVQKSFFRKVKRTSLHSRCISNLEFHEPPYLQNLKPKVPVYEAITVQVKGYDFPPLESFQGFAHLVAKYLNFDVNTCWAHPGRHYNINKYKNRSTTTERTYKLIMYERNIKLLNVPAMKLPFYVEILQTALPEGTTMNVFLFDEEHFKERFVPDHDLNAKLKELDELGGPPRDQRDEVD